MQGLQAGYSSVSDLTEHTPFLRCLRILKTLYVCTQGSHSRRRAVTATVVITGHRRWIVRNTPIRR